MIGRLVGFGAGDYVVYLGALRPQAYKVTRVSEPDVQPRQIQVSQLYGEDWVLASAFHPVSGPTLTPDDLADIQRAKAALTEAR